MDPTSDTKWKKKEDWCVEKKKGQATVKENIIFIIIFFFFFLNHSLILQFYI